MHSLLTYGLVHRLSTILKIYEVFQNKIFEALKSIKELRPLDLTEYKVYTTLKGIYVK